jgi:2-polyprenyl-3-methyl-5-hydroxy-6-metoxy-1,4-benzoquinol methylase
MIKTYKDIEGEIRKDTYRDKFFKIIEDDIERIINPYKNKFMNVTCPNCNNKKIKEEFVKGQFSFCLCSLCGTLFVNPRPPRNLLDLFYNNSKAIEASVISLIENERGRRKHIFVPRAKLILKFLKEMGKAKVRLLEVGCGIGTLLEILKNKSGVSVEGLDPSDKAFAITMAKGLKVHKDTLEKFKSPIVKYDVVLSFETIEHVFSPYYFLRKINKLLKTGGYIIFTTPNYHGFDMMVLGKYYKNIHAPSHLNYFNIDTIHILLDRTGFAIRKKMTPGILDVGIIRKQIEHGVAPEVPPVIKYFIFGISKETQYNLQRFLRDNCLSGNMMIYAEKIRNK